MDFDIRKMTLKNVHWEGPPIGNLVDEAELRVFVSALEKVYDEDPTLLLFLMVRTRYIKEKLGIKVPERQSVLQRKIIFGPDWKERLIRNVKRFAVLGYYSEDLFVISKDDKLYPVPKDTTAIYLELNPARVKKAFIKFYSGVLNDIILENRWDRIYRLEKTWFSYLHQSTPKRFRTIDIDAKIPGLKDYIMDHLSRFTKDDDPPGMVIETPRGYHIVIDLSRMKKEFFTEGMKFLNELKEDHPEIELKDRALEPIPGTLYAGFKVRLLDIW